MLTARLVARIRATFPEDLLPDTIVFGPEPDRPSTDEMLTAAYNDAVAVLRPHADAAVRVATAFMASMQTTVDALNRMARALAPVLEVRRQSISATHRDYRRRTLARKRRR